MKENGIKVPGYYDTYYLVHTDVFKLREDIIFPVYFLESETHGETPWICVNENMHEVFSFIHNPDDLREYEEDCKAEIEFLLGSTEECNTTLLPLLLEHGINPEGGFVNYDTVDKEIIMIIYERLFD